MSLAMMRIADFSKAVALDCFIHKFNKTRATELTNIATALSSDPTTHDTTRQTAPIALRPGQVAPVHTKFTNDILLQVNKGKAGGLTPTAMSNAITAGLSTFLPPVMTSAPVVSGTTTLTCTMGNWTYVPTSYAYQWLRDGATIAGANTNSHLVVAADSGHQLSCQVTASNAAGPTVAMSNAVAVP